MSPMHTSFLGSALRGSFFLALGLWGSVRGPLKRRGRAGAAGAAPGPGRAELLEGALKACFALVGILVEQFVPTGPHLQLYSPKTHSWTDLTHWQYSTIYLFFLLSGVTDVVSHSLLKLPPGLEQLSLTLALLVEGLLFCFRDYSDAVLDHHLYSLLAMAIFAGALCAFLEVFLRDHIILETLRTSSFLLQGSWLWQIGFVLSPPWGGPGWNDSDSSNLVFLTICFCWHYVGALAVVAANAAASRCCNESCQLKFGDIDVELDCGLCLHRGKKSSSGALLPESSSDDK
ncbi:transmembrane protein 45B-like [Oenanthe melanoleuca]|uniref:transmembrane protein 45B-like n=1 Tax=Oenanthe melanoleuca TaxID=2939378 RepID=UPI0024C12032|nr:transmembrane protein 45B-like [Oenanthe melanoleuca]